MQNYWNFYLSCKQQHLYGPANYRDFRETGPWLLRNYDGFNLIPVVSWCCGQLQSPNEVIQKNKRHCTIPTVQQKSGSRLRVVAHFSSGIVERTKRERAWKSPHPKKGYMRRGDFSLSPPRVAFSRVGVIFTRAHVSLALLSLRKNGRLLVVWSGSTMVFPIPYGWLVLGVQIAWKCRVKSLKSGGRGEEGAEYGGREARWRKKKTAFFRSHPLPHPPRCFSCSPVFLRCSHYLKGAGYLLTVQTNEWKWFEMGRGYREER